MSISSYFHERAEKRAEQKAFSAKVTVLADAIRQADDKVFTALFDDVKQSSLYTPMVAAGLLKTVIAKDNEPAFSAILSTCSNQNIFFTNATAGGLRGSPVLTNSEHILSLAIRSGSAKIALVLAKNTKVSVDKAGYTQVISGFAKPLTTPYEKSLASLAHEHGMQDVESVLTRRRLLESAFRSQRDKKQKPSK